MFGAVENHPVMSAIRHGDLIDVPPSERVEGVVGGVRWSSDASPSSVTVYARFEWPDDGPRWEAGPASPLALALAFGGAAAGFEMVETLPAVGLAVHVVSSHVEVAVRRVRPTRLSYRVAISAAPGRPVRAVRTLMREEGAATPLPAFCARVVSPVGVRYQDSDGRRLPSLMEMPPGAFAVAPGSPRAVACEVLR